MKILALVTDAYGGYGGIAQYNRDFVEALAQLPEVSEIDVLPRVAPESVGDTPSKVRQHRAVHSRALYSLRAAALCTSKRPDIIFSGHVYHGPLAAKLSQLTGAKLISQLHGTEIWERLPKARLEPLQKSHVVFCVSTDTLSRYHAQLMAPARENGRILHNTFDQQYTPGDRRASREKFGLTDEFVVLTVARLDGRSGYKGHDRVIQQIPQLLQHYPRSVYLIAGVGEDRCRLEQLARDYNVGTAVRFLGKVAHESLPDLYRAADLFALPSTGEGFGIVFLEATACGTPAIGLAVGGATDALIFPTFAEAVEPEDFAGAFIRMAQQANNMSELDRRNLSCLTAQSFGKAVFTGNVQASMASVLMEPSSEGRRRRQS